MKKNDHTILVTGAAGFIGAASVIGLLTEKYNVIGIDNLNEYYDLSLKMKRLENIENLSRKNNLNWNFQKKKK